MEELNSHLKREGNSSFSSSKTAAAGEQQEDKMYSFFNPGTSDFTWQSSNDYNSVCNGPEILLI